MLRLSIAIVSTSSLALLAPIPTALSQDVGDVAVVVDNGLIVTQRNAFDLNGVAVRFAPAGEHLYTFSCSAAALDPTYGPELTFGYPSATEFPGDDDTQEVAFPAGFPFVGTTYTSVWVNTDGNITFGEPDFASASRDKPRHVLGPPRISAYLMDVNAYNAFNPGGSGTIHAVAKSGPDRLVVTWNNVADFQSGVSSTFQITLYSTGVADVAIEHIDPAAVSGVTGIAEGDGAGPTQQVDLSAGPAQTLQAGAILEAFAQLVAVNEQQVAREFYKTHADKYDFLVIHTDFASDGVFYAGYVSNHTHGIGDRQPNPGIFDDSAAYGSGGELEHVVFMNNIFLSPTIADEIVNPRIEPYSPSINIIQWFEALGWPVSLDGQAMSQVRIAGTLPPDDGEFSQFFERSGSYSLRLNSLMSLMSHITVRRWGPNIRFIHPTKGNGFDSYDLLGRDIHHWSYFVNTGLPGSQFPDAPRSSCAEGNFIVDLGPLASYDGVPTNLSPGERVFLTPPNQLMDGYNMLDQYLMGLRRAEEVGPFFYVDEPRSIYTGQELDPFNPSNPLDTSVTMRAWQPMGGIVFKGKRVELTVQNIMDYEKLREGRDNPRGRRFWGPRGNLRVRYFSQTRLVDPNGDATMTLTERDRELGDEADMIDANGHPVDVKTMSFILLVEDGPPANHGSAIRQVDVFRHLWQEYANGPATGGRGRFDTRLDPPIH